MTETQHTDKMDMHTLHKILFVISAVLLVYKYCATPPIVIRIDDPKFRLLGPYNTTEIKVEDTDTQLIDIKDFAFKVNPQVCNSYPNGFLLLVIISSNPNNFENRKIIRSTWGQNQDATKVVFLIGIPENTTVANRIADEVYNYGDIVQGNFVDAYRNMTYKHVMGLKWVAHHCLKAKYVLKTDDDIVVNSKELRHFIARELSPWGATDLIACQVLKNAMVMRMDDSKWKVTPQEYADQFYPTYCAGWAILYSQDVIPRLLKAAQSTAYFWVDDVHVTGVLAEKIGIPRTALTTRMIPIKPYVTDIIFGPHYEEPFIFGPPDLSLDRMVKVWRSIT